jgi:N-ethylmaleimide reductase
MSSDLFDPLKIGDLTLAHRLVMAPLTRMRADDSLTPTELSVEYYSQRASEGGLILGEACVISPQAVASRRMPGLWLSQHRDGWRRVTAAVHERGGYICAQLWHPGHTAHASYDDHPLVRAAGAHTCVAPSAVRLDQGPVATFDGAMREHETPHALTIGT